MVDLHELVKKNRFINIQFIEDANGGITHYLDAKGFKEYEILGLIDVLKNQVLADTKLKDISLNDNPVPKSVNGPHQND